MTIWWSVAVTCLLARKEELIIVFFKYPISFWYSRPDLTQHSHIKSQKWSVTRGRRTSLVNSSPRETVIRKQVRALTRLALRNNWLECIVRHTDTVWTRRLRCMMSMLVQFSGQELYFWITCRVLEFYKFSFVFRNPIFLNRSTATSVLYHSLFDTWKSNPLPTILIFFYSTRMWLKSHATVL